MPAYISYPVFGYIYDSLGSIVSNAELTVTTSVATRKYTSDSNGIYSYDLAQIGYTSGETVEVIVKDSYNNQYKEHTFVVSGFWNEEDITLSLRTEGVNVTGYSPRTILHSIGNNPITEDNRLPVKDETRIYEERRSYNSDNQVEYIGEAEPGSEDTRPVWRIHKRTYSNKRLTKISWAGYNEKFNKIWNNRSSYNYR